MSHSAARPTRGRLPPPLPFLVQACVPAGPLLPTTSARASAPGRRARGHADVRRRTRLRDGHSSNQPHFVRQARFRPKGARSEMAGASVASPVDTPTWCVDTLCMSGCPVGHHPYQFLLHTPPHKLQPDETAQTTRTARQPGPARATDATSQPHRRGPRPLHEAQRTNRSMSDASTGSSLWARSAKPPNTTARLPVWAGQRSIAPVLPRWPSVFGPGAEAEALRRLRRHTRERLRQLRTRCGPFRIRGPSTEAKEGPLRTPRPAGEALRYDASASVGIPESRRIRLQWLPPPSTVQWSQPSPLAIGFDWPWRLSRQAGWLQKRHPPPLVRTTKTQATVAMRVGGTALPENERPLVSGFRRKSGDAASELGDFLGAYVEVRRCLKAPVPDTQFVSVAISVPVKANLQVQAHVHTLPVSVVPRRIVMVTAAQHGPSRPEPISPRILPSPARPCQCEAERLQKNQHQVEIAQTGRTGGRHDEAFSRGN